MKLMHASLPLVCAAEKARLFSDTPPLALNAGASAPNSLSRAAGKANTLSEIQPLALGLEQKRNPLIAAAKAAAMRITSLISATREHRNE